MTNDIIFANNQKVGKKLVKKIKGKNPLFLCVIASTDTAKIPGLSAAGQNPKLTDYTPPADAELLYYRRCKCFKGIPITPDGIPTPALLTASALRMAKIPFFIVCGGLRITPQIPYIEVGGLPGSNITSGEAVKNPLELIERAKLIGQNFAQNNDYLIIGESIPAGTTTALSLLLALGIDAKGKVSSSMPINPHNLKTQIAEQGLKSAGITFGELKDDPIEAIRLVGDPMQAVTVGIILGVNGKIPLLLAGGTQMAAVATAAHYINPNSLKESAIATTRWIVHDTTADICSLINQTSNMPIIAVNLDFHKSNYEGLKAYERGVVKEGVGAGGVVAAAILKSRNKITCKILERKIESDYSRLIEG